MVQLIAKFSNWQKESPTVQNSLKKNNAEKQRVFPFERIESRNDNYQNGLINQHNHGRKWWKMPVKWCLRLLGALWDGLHRNRITSNYCGYHFPRRWQLTCPAVRAHPAIKAHLGPRRLAAIVAKVVVTRNTQLIALVAVVVLVTSHSDAIDEASHRPVVPDGLPGVGGVDRTSVNAAFNQQLLLTWNKNQSQINHVKFWLDSTTETWWTFKKNHLLTNHPHSEEDNLWRWTYREFSIVSAAAALAICSVALLILFTPSALTVFLSKNTL